MKTNIALIGLLIIFFSSCTSPRYLPSSDKIDVNEYGSYIKIIHKTASNIDGELIAIDGELIAIDSNKIVVLTEQTKKCLTIPISEIKHFKLRHAKQKHYGWTIPVFTLATIAHGSFLKFTAPANLIVTISVTASGENAFKYSDKDMSYEKLRMFARFPQGIPSNIDLASIK
ncbi:MAG: hypothetical protein FJZ66_10110 [Bacteroidetes bacterium]|nr:hypothetical protein [Bacteroidota bacterium]